MYAGKESIFCGKSSNALIFMFVPCISNINTLLLKSNWCTLLVALTLNEIKIKVTINTPTCFGSRRNHLQGVSQCLAKAIYIWFFVHVDGDAVNGMAAYQPVVLVCVLCGGRMKTVFILPPQSTHTNTTSWYAAIPLTASPSTCTKNHIYTALAKHWEIPWRWFLREPKHVGVFIVTLILILIKVDATSNVRQLDFNKRVSSNAHLGWSRLECSAGWEFSGFSQS
jgi:hypothetical protein